MARFVWLEGDACVQDFYALPLDAFRYKGEIYGLPAVSVPTVVAYNADLLARGGLKPPPADWTFDDFVALATAVASTSDTDRTYGMIYDDQWEDSFFTGRGIEWADLDADPPVPCSTSWRWL